MTHAHLDAATLTRACSTLTTEEIDALAAIDYCAEMVTEKRCPRAAWTHPFGPVRAAASPPRWALVGFGLAVVMCLALGLLVRI